MKLIFRPLKKLVIFLAMALVMMPALQSGEIGMEAPAIAVTNWIKGEPVEFTEAGDTIYVLEFWATWCGPCRESIPHLSRLQKKYKDKNIEIIGISDEDPEKVRKFVQKMGDNMAYTVAVSKDGKMHRNYMSEFGARGIPHAFVIDRQHRIIWEGHPLSQLEQVIEKLVNGEFDLNDAKKIETAKKRQTETFAKMEKYFSVVLNGEENEEATELAASILKNAEDNPGVLNQFSWVILTHPQIKFRNLKLALKAAEAAHKASFEVDPNVADTLARAYFDNGMKDKAIAMQQRAVELADGDPRKVKAFTEVLESYRNSKE